METIILVFGGVFGLMILLALVASGGWPGSGADLVDWDPSKRIEARMNADREDDEQMLAMHNRRRREKGLPEQTEDEYREAVTRGET